MNYDIFQNMAVLREVYPSLGGIQSGVTGAWYTRDLVEVTSDPSGIITSLVNSAFTLEAGTYFCHARTGAYNINACRLRLHDTTNDVTLSLGSNTYGAYAAVTPCPDLQHSFLNSVFTLNSQTVIESQFRCSASNGFLGVNNPYGDNGTHTVILAKCIGTPRISILRQESANGTTGGVFNSGAWRTRILNTAHYNGIPNLSLNSNVITIPVGTYYIWAQAPQMYAGTSTAALYNVTDDSYDVKGNQVYSNPTVADGRPDSANNIVQGFLTVSGSAKNFELHHYCSSSSGSTYGFGRNCSFGVNELYSEIVIMEIA